MQLKIASIGGKDSMSGSFEDLDVPPTLVSFAVSTAHADRIVSTEFKSAAARSRCCAPGAGKRPAGLRLRAGDLFRAGGAHRPGQGPAPRGSSALAASPRACSRWGWATAWASPSRATSRTRSSLRRCRPPSCSRWTRIPAGAEEIGAVTVEYALAFRGQSLPLEALQTPYEAKLQGVFPYLAPTKDEAVVTAYRATGKPPRPRPRTRSRARAC